MWHGSLKKEAEKMNEKFKERVDELGLTTFEVADLCGVGVTSVRRLLFREGTEPRRFRFHTVAKLADGLGMELDDIVPPESIGPLRGKGGKKCQE